MSIYPKYAETICCLGQVMIIFDNITYFPYIFTLYSKIEIEFKRLGLSLQNNIGINNKDHFTSPFNLNITVPYQNCQASADNPTLLVMSITY
jgi:hypothetical protein